MLGIRFRASHSVMGKAVECGLFTLVQAPQNGLAARAIQCSNAQYRDYRAKFLTLIRHWAVKLKLSNRTQGHGLPYGLRVSRDPS